ncbi:unnamed protein product, partial [Ectocarpus sp. 13 AM-2016]
GQDNGGRGSRVDRCAGTAQTGGRGRGSPQLPIEESLRRGQSLFPGPVQGAWGTCELATLEWKRAMARQLARIRQPRARPAGNGQRAGDGVRPQAPAVLRGRGLRSPGAHHCVRGASMLPFRRGR